LNKQDKILLKIAEELSELTSRLLQHVNKSKDYSRKILSEIEDVEKQLALIKNLSKEWCK
jgi:predicted RNA-binding protein with EMAP domain